MSRHNANVEVVCHELARVGLKADVSYCGSGHVRVSWTVNGQTRAYFAAHSSRSVRGTWNARSVVRRMLRQDGITVG